MTPVIFRPPTEADLDELARHMRALDQAECRALAEMEPREALADCVTHALWAYAAEIDGKVWCVFGLSAVGLLSGQGTPWMLCRDGIEAHAKAVITQTKRFLGEMEQSFETLANLVSADNRNAIRFLRWCGFELGEPQDMGGTRVIAFEKKRAA